LEIRLPNIDEAYRANPSDTLYTARKFDVKPDPNPSDATGKTNIVKITIRPGQGTGTPLKFPPQVFVHVGSDLNAAQDVPATADKPYIIINLPDYFQQNLGVPLDVPDHPTL
jgi:hypothetical protein